MAGRNTVEIILSAQDRASRALRDAFGSINESNNRFLGGLVSMKTLVAGAFATLGGYIAKTGVDYDTMVESSTIAWTTLLGSQTKAKQMLQDISTFAKNTQFDTEGVDAMAKYFHNAGFEGKNLFDELQRIADVSGAFNITAANAQELARQMSQVDQAGVAYTQDLDILQNQGIPIFKAIAAEVGTNVGAVRKMASQGKITADVYNKAFNSIAKTVQGASDAQSKTFSGMLSTLQDDFGIISGILAKPLFNVMHEGLTKLLPVLDGFTSLARGDFKTFSQTMEKTFGGTAGKMVVSFTQSIIQGFQIATGYINKAKIVLMALFDYIKGDDMGGLTLLTKLGLDPAQVVKIDAVLMGVIGFIKGFVSGAEKVFSNLFSGKNNLSTSFQSVFTTIKKIVVMVFGDTVKWFQNAIIQLKQFWDKDGAKITQAVKDAINMIAVVLKALQPVLTAVWNSVKTVGMVVFNAFIAVAKAFGGNLNWLLPIIVSTTAAIKAFQIISTVINLIKSWQIVTKTMIAVQTALDVVLNLNPIGVIITAIGLLIGAGIALYQNWGTVSTKLSAIWNSIERGAASMVNGIIDKINGLINVIDHIPGVSIPLIPKVSWGNNPPPSSLTGGTGTAGSSNSSTASLGHFASGTDNFSGGFAMVGENGPEIAEFPPGTRIHNNSDSKKMLGGKQTVYNVTVNAKTADIDEKQLVAYLRRMEGLNLV